MITEDLYKAFVSEREAAYEDIFRCAWEIDGKPFTPTKDMLLVWVKGRVLKKDPLILLAARMVYDQYQIDTWMKERVTIRDGQGNSRRFGDVGIGD